MPVCGADVMAWGLGGNNQNSHLADKSSRVPFRFNAGSQLGQILSRGSAERIWGEFVILVRQKNFSANFDGEFSSRTFLANFSVFFCQHFSPPPKTNSRPKFTSRNCRHSSPISLSRTHFFFTPIFCLLGSNCRSFKGQND